MSGQILKVATRSTSCPTAIRPPVTLALEAVFRAGVPPAARAEALGWYSAVSSISLLSLHRRATRVRGTRLPSKHRSTIPKRDHDVWSNCWLGNPERDDVPEELEHRVVFEGRCLTCARSGHGLPPLIVHVVLRRHAWFDTMAGRSTC